MEENLIKSSITNPITNKWDYYVFLFALIDTLFLPYFWLVSVPLSLPVVIYWSIKRYNHIRVLNEFKLIKIMFLLMTFSTIIGSIIQPHNIYENCVFLIKYYYIFMLYLLFRSRLNSKDISLKKILLVFVFFVLIMAIVYYYDKNLYQSFKIIWNYKSNVFVSSRYIGLVGYRYSFIWMDPNNIGYMLTAVVMYLFTNEKTSFFTKIVLITSLGVVLIATMSNGSILAVMISLCVYLLVWIFTRLLRAKVRFRVSINPVNVALFYITILLIIYFIPKIPNLLETTTAVEAFERFESNSGDSRFKIWTDIIKNISIPDYFLYSILGKGGVTLVGQREIAPHNGHLYWILGYGLVSYLIFMYIVFRKRRNTPLIKYIWIVPVFIGFTINTMIGEMKLFGLIMLLVASSSNILYKTGKHNTMQKGIKNHL